MCNDVVFVFNDESGVAVMAMTRGIVQSVPTPTEFRLVSEWKKAAAAAEKNAGKATLLARGVGAGCVCSFSPHLDSATAAAASAPDPTSAGSGGTALDKRTILRQLQAQCPLIFLREHKLNGPEDLVLKKVPRAGIEGAWVAWRQKEQEQRFGGAALSTSFPDIHSASPTASQLQQTFEVLLERVSKPPPCRNTILLLHEDYASSLPLYDSRGHDHEQQQHVICLLGAVRDASDCEVAACLAAVSAINRRRSFSISVAGCNLGRTAEFTSKICGALCMHALSGALGGAVRTVIDAALVSASASASSAGADGSRVVAVTCLLPPTKIAPQRAGGWTWDGRGNKPAISAAVNVEQIEQGFDSQQQQMHLCFALWAPFTCAEFTTLASASAPALGSASADQAQQPLPQNRENLQALVQAVVCVLWRSRVASEHSATASAARHDKPQLNSSSALAVVPSIAIVFSDGSTLWLSQQAAVRLSSAHQAAPTERQVLSSLLQELGQTSAVKYAQGLVPAPPGTNSEQLATTVLALAQAARAQAGLAEEAGTKAGFAIVALDSIAPLVTPPSSSSSSTTTAAAVLNSLNQAAARRGLSDYIYRPSAATAATGEQEDPSSGLLRCMLVLLRLPPGTDGLHPWVANSSLRKCTTFLPLLTTNHNEQEGSSSSIVSISAGLAATLLLQWAYSGVLSNAVKQAVTDSQTLRRAQREAKRESKRARRER